MRNVKGKNECFFMLKCYKIGAADAVNNSTAKKKAQTTCLEGKK